MSDGRRLALFDFDKTLVSSDSFRLFADMGAGSAIRRGLVFAFAAVCKLGWIDNRRYKELVLDRVWKTRPPEERSALLRDHAEAMRAIEITSVWSRLRAHLDAGDHVAVLSASPEFYLVPYLDAVSTAIEVHGSKVEDVASGTRVDNLFRDQKAARAKEIVERANPSHTVVYTDHIDDVGLMKLADEVHLVRPSERMQEQVREAGIVFEVLAP